VVDTDPEVWSVQIVDLWISPLELFKRYDDPFSLVDQRDFAGKSVIIKKVLDNAISEDVETSPFRL